MKNILKIYKRDLKKIFTNSMAIMLGLIYMPTGTHTALQAPEI